MGCGVVATRGSGSTVGSSVATDVPDRSEGLVELRLRIIKA